MFVVNITAAVGDELYIKPCKTPVPQFNVFPACAGPAGNVKILNEISSYKEA